MICWGSVLLGLGGGVLLVGLAFGLLHWSLERIAHQQWRHRAGEQ